MRRISALAAAALVAGSLVACWATSPADAQKGPPPCCVAPTPTGDPPPPGGYFNLRKPGANLPSGQTCAGLVQRSTWEPRPSNFTENATMPDPAAVHTAFTARPRSGPDHSYDPRWDSYLLARVDGQFTGTTDEIFQWAACKWGLPDNVLRGQAVRESTWYQYETYPSGRCVWEYGCGDAFSSEPYQARKVYCDAVATYGYDYQQDFGDGYCPKTWSIIGEMAWQNPTWGQWPDNQNGTFPFSRDSTAFAVDYEAAELRGCYEGWEWWLTKTSGDLWGCVGAWYAGDWHSSDADGYIGRVKHEIAIHHWLKAGWPTNGPPCDQYGCPTWRR